MTAIMFIAFLFIVSGFFIIFRINPLEFIHGLGKLFEKKNVSLRSKINEVTNPKKVKGIRKLIFDSQEMLRMTNREDKFTILSMASIGLFVFGAFFSVTIGNLFLLPVLSVGMALLPFTYVMFLSNKWKKDLNAELETALSIITTSYMRSEDLISAFEENILYINPPVSDVLKVFLTNTKLISSNIKLALEALKVKIDHDVFEEWCDALIACQDDKTMKVTLVPIVSKLSDIRVVSAELANILYGPIKEYITMVLLLISNIPLLYFLNKDWFAALMHTKVGNIYLAICLAIMFFSMISVIRLGRPVEYSKKLK